MADENVPQTTLRDALEASFNEVEQAAPAEIGQPRDDAGRFAQKPREEAKPEPVEQPQAQPAQPQWAGPSTWKKEYRPLYDKLAAGAGLTPDEAKKLAQYNLERENDFKTGVSTYKAEATAAKELQEAITPFLPELKANGLNPGQWIRQLGQAHYALAKGQPELKLQVFRELARQYGVPLGAVMQQPGQVAPGVAELMGLVNQLQQQVGTVTNRFQQQEQTSLTSEIERFKNDTQNHPHFEAVRGTMAQLLETGLAHDLNTAYAKAVWMQDDTRQAMQSALVPKADPVVKAKRTAVSPKSATPSGQVATSGAKDRRAALEEAFDQHSGGRV